MRPPLGLCTARNRGKSGWRVRAARLGAIGFAVSALACSSGRSTEGDVAAKRQAACSSGALFGFENTTSWTATGGTLAASTRRVEGERAVRIEGGADLTVQSAAACLDGANYGRIAFYLSNTTVAAAQPVTVSVELTSPSRGLAAAAVGSVIVGGLGNGLFRRVELGLPASIATKLATTATDLRVKLTLRAPGGTQSLLLDGLNFDAAPLAAATGAPTESHVVSVPYPSAVGFLDTALSANAGLTIADRAQVLKPSSGFASIVSTAGPATEIGTEARVGNVTSIPSVMLRDRASINGTVTTSGTLLRGAGTTITGTVTTGATVPLNTLSWQVQFQQGTEQLALEPAVDRTAAPGPYGQVVLKNTSKLRLQTGTYYFRSLDVQSGANLILNTSGGPVVIYVRDSVNMRGTLSYTGRSGDLLLVYLGTPELAFDTTFSGVLVAPNANVRFGVGSSSHSGAAFAKFVRLDPQAKFTHQAALPLLAGTPSPRECADLLSASAYAQSASQVAFQEALLRYCGGSDAGPCETTLLARINVDYYTAAARLLQDGITTKQHLALMMDRERKVQLIHGNEALSCAIVNGDADGDFVPVPQDLCPNTPPLTATLENGCTDPVLPGAPPIEDVKRALPDIAIPGDPRCKNAPLPTIPSPFGAWRHPPDASVGKALWISRDDNEGSGCQIWYQLEGLLTDGSMQTAVFTAADDRTLPWIQKPANTLQFNVKVSDGGGRGAWARYDVWTQRYRVRAFNAAGLRSGWSDWFRPGSETCAAGTCDF